MTGRGHFFNLKMTKFTTFFTENNIEIKNKKFLLAASGGPDSVALLKMLVNFLPNPSEQLIVAHLDHCLRDDSFLESQLLQRLTSALKVKLVEKKWPVELHPQAGVEAKAREYRYAFLAKVGRKYQTDYLLTAHHGDDLIENILLKFIRSGDVAEMNSLQIVGNLGSMKLLRPLVKYSKDELLKYDKDHHLDFIEDKTNFEDDTLRNRLRHYVVPLLKKETSHLVKNANHFSESVALLSKCQSDLFDSLPSPINFSKALRGKKEDIARLNTHEAAAFFDYLIYKKWHQRIHFDEIDLNKNVIFNKENFQLLFYQKYYYLINRNELAVIDPKRKLVKLNEKFSLNGKKYLITQDEKSQKLAGYFYGEKAKYLEVGSLPQGSTLKLATGKQTKAKKKFAENGIPLALRPYCLTVWQEEKPVYVESVYQNQEYNPNFIRYNVYIYF